MAILRNLSEVNSLILQTEKDISSNNGILSFGQNKNMQFQRNVMLNNQLQQLKGEKDALTRYDTTLTVCGEIDKKIKSLDIEIADKSTSAVSSETEYSKSFLQTLNLLRSKFKRQYEDLSCTFELENIKAKELAGIIGVEIEKFDKEIQQSSKKSSLIYFIIGGIFITSSLFIILKLTKK